ncbi:beta-lactamase family protein [Amylibacter sp. SFDW26]|uniref:serine hydrolase domain-containing protein n=1 Tax=Amylibacter sp. SFDW26 TaxID=2652722 RepID=UPI001261BBE9|nr:serine hydrolase domain-containing protein [Amylibacter sp. SFDW26]KAB7615392.1 beta-lactamase family protein [Amylibacter sp. SFDW26]
MTGQKVYSHWIASSGSEGGNAAPDLIFPYWSFTKTVIAICALKLVEDGQLDLDARFQGQDYTLRHLLAHTSGLPDYGQFKEYGLAVSAGDPPWSREKLLDVTMSKGHLFEPEQGWSYSNIGYMFIRELIEEITGKPIGDVITDIVSRPLGLDSVEFAHTRQDFARVYWDDAEKYDPRWVYHGCLLGNAKDATHLLHALFTSDVLLSDTRDQMFAKRILGGPIEGRPWQECGYALGLMSGSISGLGNAVGHSGAGPLCVNAVYHFPDIADPVTVASFTDGTDEGVAEHAAAKLAREQ